MIRLKLSMILLKVGIKLLLVILLKKGSSEWNITMYKDIKSLENNDLKKFLKKV